MLKYFRSDIICSSCSEQQEHTRRITAFETELASVVRINKEIRRKLDDALYEVQILEGAVKDRDKKIKALRNNLRYIQMSVQEGLGD